MDDPVLWLFCALQISAQIWFGYKVKIAVRCCSFVAVRWFVSAIMVDLLEIGVMLCSTSFTMGLWVLLVWPVFQLEFFLRFFAGATVTYGYT
ncbi:hypothetical protein OUZ56_028089 [Daphnia magna]|uniref:Uncharacterized protein n=1 Tax=Daphnia magna TaxID=35525 RepID=A0ABR0B3G1_9CRUS|nr:hypothetical protein OUZ56_028089 [Daphnia magna]